MFSQPFLDIPPLQSAQGTIELPGSKSISNRVLLLAALCDGCTTLEGLLDSDDTAVMLTALKQLGCGIERIGSSVRVTGRGPHSEWSEADLFLGNAGTAIRPLLAALALKGGSYRLSGVKRMHERPIGDLVDALRQMGCDISYEGTEGFPPLCVRPARISFEGAIVVRGDVSSQFLTALLLTLPLVATKDVVIEVQGELISKPYVDITLKLLTQFGVNVQREGWQRFTVPAGSRYQSPGTLWVEADASSASYFIALGGLGCWTNDRKVPQSHNQTDPKISKNAGPTESAASLRIHGLSLGSIQGDIRFVDAARLMGVHVHAEGNTLVSRGDAWPLQAIDLDCNHIPDAAMTLAVMALYANGTTTLRNIGSWRVKETDRIDAMARELRKLGASVQEGADWIAITPPQSVAHWRSASIHTYDDHRMAMCFSLAAFNPAGVSVRIEDPRCVGKTFPNYFETLFSVVMPKPGHISVLCIDGPTASGKGTLASRVAQRLGFHYLDSGALYRTTALAAQRAGVDLTDEAALAALAAELPVTFVGSSVLLAGEDVSEAIRSEAAGMAASQVSVFGQVRRALVALQLRFAKLPGLVADGRDMGSVIFPSAQLKIFLTASSEHRAERRHKQLISKGISAKLEGLRADLAARDARDSNRAVSPLMPAQDALLLDNSALSIEESVEKVLGWWQSKTPLR